MSATDKGKRLGFLVLGILALGEGLARAQGGPVILFAAPPSSSSPESLGTPPIPSTGSPSSGDTHAKQRAKARQTGAGSTDSAVKKGTVPVTEAASPFQVQPLAPVDMNSQGLLSPVQAALPQSVWTGGDGSPTDRLSVIALYDLLEGSPVPALADLNRRLLLLAAPAPAAGGTAQRAVYARLGALLRSGLTDDMRALAGGLSRWRDDGAIRRLVAESYIVDHRMDSACATTGEELARSTLGSTVGTFWQKAAVVCGLLKSPAVSSAQASLQLGLLRDRGEVAKDPLFFWQAERLTGLRSTAPNSLNAPTPLAMALLRESGVSWSADMLVRPQGWLARSLAVVGRTAKGVEKTSQRGIAGEHAFVRAALDRAAYRALLKTVSVPAALVQSDLATLVRKTDILASVALWRRFHGEKTPQAQAAVVRAAWTQAANRDRVLAMARLYAPEVQGWTPRAALIPYAPVIARVLLGDGRTKAARTWIRAAAPPGTKIFPPVGPLAADSTTAHIVARHVVARHVVARLWALDHLVTGSVPRRISPRSVALWRQSWTEPSEAVMQEQRFLALLEAIGAPLDRQHWSPLWAPSMASAPTPNGWSPPLSVRIALRQAADARRVGETVALSVIATGGRTVSAMSDQTLVDSVRALALAGLEKDSHALAVQAALAWGF